MTLITEEQVRLAEQEIQSPKFGPLGWITDYRTYRRWLPEENRRETIFERNQRVVNYNLSLVADLESKKDQEEEAQLMFDYMNNFLADASGRTKWVGGTVTTSRHPAANFNCSFLAINRLDAFLTLFELLMLGTGVGYRVFERDIMRLPQIRNRVDIEFKDYAPKEAKDRVENTYGKAEKIDGIETTTVYVGDSRQGWIDGLNIYLYNTHYNPEKCRIVFDLNNVRPMGERILGFGGTASGPQAFQGILEDIDRIYKEAPPRMLGSIDCMDICDAIAKGVVAGSSRRSALICLFDEGDEACASAKANMPDYKTYRWQSNNTECIGSHHTSKLRGFLEKNPDATLTEILDFTNQFKPGKDWFVKRFKVIEATGEPGLNNYLLMCAKRWIAVRQWRKNVPVEKIWETYCDLGTNPCHEILLNAGIDGMGQGVSFCNLTTLPLQNFVIADPNRPELNVINYSQLETAVRLITRIGLRQTNVTMPRQELHDTQIEERLLGVSATGWRKMMDIMGWETGGDEIAALQRQMREWANDEATAYSSKLGVNRPLLVTCIKPEGTASKVYGSSDGLHWEWSPYYIRRIQMSTTDALAQALKAQGFPWHPTPYDLDRIFADVGKDTWDRIKHFDALDPKEQHEVFLKANAVQFSFPIKANSSVAQGDVSALEQLENVRSFSVNYTDHMPSSTITVKEHEWSDVASWVFENWKDYTTAAFLSYWSGNYPLLPYEDITKEEYETLLAKFDSKYLDGESFVVDEKLVNAYEVAALLDDQDIDALDASTGACPVR